MDFTEPMTIGSPVNSPGHVSPAHQSSHGNLYLPPYLMGELNVSGASGLTRSKSILGGSQHNSPSVNFNMMSRSPPQKNSNRTPKQTHFASVPVPPKEKAGAPPVQSLMDDVAHHGETQSPGFTDIFSQSSLFHDTSSTSPFIHGTLSTPRRPHNYKVLTPIQNKTPPSPGQADPFYTQGELITPDSQLDDTWVTVFGFPSTSASFVLQRFSQYGNVVEHRTASDGGNWMHVHYETTLQAKKALSRNGKVFPGNIMIGVVPCIDVKAMTESKNLQKESASCSKYQSPMPQSSLNRTGTPSRTPKPATMRPLTSAYYAAASDAKVVSDVKTPQKTSGMITKAIDYLFG